MHVRMLVSEALAEELMLHPQNCKPDISIENYVLQWSSDSAGIPRSEEANLRAFVRELATHISTAIFEASNEMHKGISRYTQSERDSRKIEESLKPCICLSKRTGTAAYLAVMDRDGRTVISLMQKPVAPEPLKSASKMPYVLFELGELVFDRRPRRK
jgi:hypothetical protein